MWRLGQKNEAIRLWDLVLTIPGFTVIDCGPQMSAVQHHACHRCLPDGACCHWGSANLSADAEVQRAGSDMSPALGRQYYLQVLWKNSQHSWIVDTTRSLILDVFSVGACLTRTQSIFFLFVRSKNACIMKLGRRKIILWAAPAKHHVTLFHQLEAGASARLVLLPVNLWFGQELVWFSTVRAEPGATVSHSAALINISHKFSLSCWIQN